MKKILLLTLFLLQPLWNVCIPPAAIILPLLTVDAALMTCLFCYECRECCDDSNCRHSQKPTEKDPLITEQPKQEKSSPQE